MSERVRIAVLMVLVASLLAACSPAEVEVTQEVPVTVEVTREVPATVEVTREVPVTVEVPTTVEVMREVPVTVEVTVEVEVPAEPLVPDVATVPNTDVIHLHSSVNGQDYRIIVALPYEEFDQGAGYKKLPVVYLLDSFWWLPITGPVSQHLGLDGLLERGMIVVAIGYPTDDFQEFFSRRTQDFLPTHTEFGGGGAEKFLRFIQEELFPTIDATYRTDPADRTLVGHSYGGVFVLYTLFEATDTFQRYLAMSPALWWDDGVVFEYEEAYGGTHEDLPVDLFLSVGELEAEIVEDGTEFRMVSNVKELHQRLVGRGYPGLDMEMMIVEGVSHASSYPGAITRGLLAVFTD